MTDNKLLEGKKRLHFIGIGGSGMYPIVQILHAAGYEITGSDVNEGDIIDYERAMGIRVFIPHAAENIKGADLIVYSAAIMPGNPEMEEAERLGIPRIERSVMLGYVASLYQKPVCIAGTHGKTSTTAMTAQALLMCGKDPAAVIGGKLPYIGGYGKSGRDESIVVESCEYHNTFLELTPYYAVLLNIDNDHLEFFGSMDNLKAAFRKFCASATGAVLYNGDDENSRQALAGLEKKCVTFGLSDGCDYRAVNVTLKKPGFFQFDVAVTGKAPVHVSLGVPGRHHIYNALACFAVCSLLGCAPQDIAQGIAAFGGAGRRFEVLGHVGGVTIADDYAHHPTELEATLKAAKEMGFHQVWAVFQPFTFSRTKMLLDDFARVLSIADHVVMTEIMGSRETNDSYQVYTKDLAAKIPGSVWFDTFEEVAGYTMSHAQQNDLVITLGCGDVYKAAKLMLKYNA